MLIVDNRGLMVLSSDPVVGFAAFSLYMAVETPVTYAYVHAQHSSPAYGELLDANRRERAGTNFDEIP